MTNRSSMFITVSMLLCAATFGQDSATQTQVAPPPAQGESETDAELTAAEDKSVEQLIQETIEILDTAADLRRDQAELTSLQSVFDEASQNVQAILEREPSNPWLFYLRGRAYSLTGKPADAAQELRQFVETREGRNEWRAYRSLGDLFYENFPRLARSHYKKALGLKAGDSEILIGLSRCHLKFGEKDEAIRFAREAVNADRRTKPEYVSHLASLLQDAEQWDEALREAESAVELARKSVEAKPGLRGPLRELDMHYGALLDILQSRLSRADTDDLQDCVRLAEHGRAQAEIIRTLALHDVLLLIQRRVDAVEGNRSPQLLEQYGVLLAEVGRTDDAIAAFDELLQSDPGNATASQWLKRLRPASPD